METVNGKSSTTTFPAATFDATALDMESQDVAGMIATARRIALSGDTDAVVHILEAAEQRMERHMLPATMAARDHAEALPAQRQAGIEEPAPAAAAHPGGAVRLAVPGERLHQVQEAAESVVLGLAKLDAALSAFSTSAGDEDELRECLFFALDGLQRIRDHARSTFDLAAELCRAPERAKSGI